jgi:hypothetical protein
MAEYFSLFLGDSDMSFWHSLFSSLHLFGKHNKRLTPAYLACPIVVSAWRAGLNSMVIKVQELIRRVLLQKNVNCVLACVKDAEF